MAVGLLRTGVVVTQFAAAAERLHPAVPPSCVSWPLARLRAKLTSEYAEPSVPATYTLAPSGDIAIAGGAPVGRLCAFTHPPAPPLTAHCAGTAGVMRPPGTTAEAALVPTSAKSTASAAMSTPRVVVLACICPSL